MINNSSQEFEKIIHKYKSSLCKIVATFEADLELQKDLYQEILLEIWKALRSFKGNSSVHTYIYKVAYNQALNHVAKSCRSLKPKYVDDTVLDNHKSQRFEPEHYVRSELNNQSLFSAIRMLPVLKRQLITLCLEGLSYNEIAEVTGLKANNVAVQLNRTKKQLKQILENHYE